MANEVVLAEFHADLSKVKKDFDEYVKSLEKASKAEDKLGNEAEQSAKQQQTAAQKRKELLKQEEAELKRLTIAKRQAFSVADISAFNTKINESAQRIKILKDESSGFGSGIKSSLAGIGAGIAAAFSIQAIGAFASASIDAFLEAEQNANKLAFAIKEIGNESESAFQNLIKQSEEIQKVSIFSDDQIQQAQTALATFGLTADQIEALIPGLADFATVTGQSIEQAAQAVGGGLQGMGREFKRFGIEVDATKTPLENLSAITEGFAKFQGAAAKETETLTGQLKQQANEVDNLQERIGEGLAPAWVAVKKAIFEATLAVIDYFKNYNFSGGLVKIAENQSTAIQDVTKQLKIQTDQNIEAGMSQEEASKRAILSIQKELAQRVQLRIESIKQLQQSGKAEAIPLAAIKLNDARKLLSAIQQIAKETNEVITDSTLQASDLQGKSLEELNKLLKQNESINTLVAQSNVKIIERVIDQRKKELEALKKVNEELSKKKQIEIEGQARLDNQERIDKDLQRQNEASAKASEAINQESINNQLGQEEQFVEDLNRLNEQSVKDREAASKQIEKDLEASAKERNRIAQVALLEEVQQISEFVSFVGQFFNQLSENRINNIQQDTDATLNGLNLQEQAIDQALEKNRISEEQALQQKRDIEKQKVEAQKKADAEIRRIKRQQATIDKIAALFEITIATAVNVAKATTPQGKLLAAASGAAQAAIVAAQPIPSYAKGTKDSGKEGLAQVHKDEILFLPAKSKVLPARKSKQYSEAIDAMFDGNFDQYIHNTYVTKEVERVAQKKEAVKSRTFADNIAQSIDYQSGIIPSLRDRKVKGTKIDNVNELADAIASKLIESRYRK